MDEEFFGELARILEMDPDEVDENLQISPADWESVATLSVIALIDEKFGVTIPTERLVKCTTVSAMIRLAQEFQAAGQGSQ